MSHIRSSLPQSREIWNEISQFLNKARDTFTHEYTEIESQYLAVQNMVQIQYVNDLSVQYCPLLVIYCHNSLALFQKEILMARVVPYRNLNIVSKIPFTCLMKHYSAISVTFEGVRKNRKTIDRASAALVSLRDKVSLFYQPLQDGLANGRLVFSFTTSAIYCLKLCLIHVQIRNDILT